MSIPALCRASTNLLFSGPCRCSLPLLSVQCPHEKSLPTGALVHARSQALLLHLLTQTVGLAPRSPIPRYWLSLAELVANSSQCPSKASETWT